MKKYIRNKWRDWVCRHRGFVESTCVKIKRLVDMLLVWCDGSLVCCKCGGVGPKDDYIEAGDTLVLPIKGLWCLPCYRRFMKLYRLNSEARSGYRQVMNSAPPVNEGETLFGRAEHVWNAELHDGSNASWDMSLAREEEDQKREEGVRKAQELIQELQDELTKGKVKSTKSSKKRKKA